MRRLATGGMAEIYLARTRGPHGFEKLVVIKRILPEYARDKKIIDMFLAEARLAALLQHSNIAQVYEVGQEVDDHFFAMEFLHGADAGRLVRVGQQRQKPLPLEHAISIVLGACAGLHSAHDKALDGTPLDIVHRDVSPSNIFVTYDGQTKVVDFGIAKTSAREAKTRTGTLKGKAAYMSPEQIRAQPLDRRSDVFGLGVVLWELTVGRRLFKCDNEFETLKRIMEEDAPLQSRFVADFPPELERITARALARARELRYQSAEELQLELEHFARERKLVISPVALGRHMREVFSIEIDDWERAQRSGKNLAEHLLELPESSFTDDDEDETVDKASPESKPQKTVVEKPWTVALPTATLPLPSPAAASPLVPLAARTAWIGVGVLVGLSALGVVGWRELRPPRAEERGAAEPARAVAAPAVAAPAAALISPPTLLAPARSLPAGSPPLARLRPSRRAVTARFDKSKIGKGAEIARKQPAKRAVTPAAAVPPDPDAPMPIVR